MSYEIVYSRAFIKTSRGIIPLILTGSNNCYECHGRYERREREWSQFWGNKHVEMDAQDLLTFMADYGADKDNYDFCDFRGKRLYKKDAYRELSILMIVIYNNGAGLGGRFMTCKERRTINETIRRLLNLDYEHINKANKETIDVCVDDLAKLLREEEQ